MIKLFFKTFKYKGCTINSVCICFTFIRYLPNNIYKNIYLFRSVGPEPITIYINVSILAFPDIDTRKVINKTINFGSAPNCYENVQPFPSYLSPLQRKSCTFLSNFDTKKIWRVEFLKLFKL